MSSVSFNIGFSNERNSSRVLKPPGGGHTDIFGVKEDPPVVQPVKEEGGENGNKTENGANEEEPQPQKIEEDLVIEDKTPVDENVKPKEESKAEPPKRMRVPPGGFSSGLW